MTIKDIMARAGLSIYGEISLLVFFLAFIVILWRTYSPKRRAEMRHMAELPLDDDAVNMNRSGRN